jgi:Kdo2-lipid IVA lauroyltransferase/acyltransferase
MLFFRLLSQLPFSALYALSDFLFFMSYYVVRYRRRLVTKNLKNAFPEKSRDELKHIQKTFYKSLSDYSVETIKLLSISPQELSRRMNFVDTSVIRYYKDQGQSVIILSSHHFNWEWLLTSAGLSLPLPIDFVYQKVNNQFFNNYSLTCRTRFGAHAIEREEVGRDVIKRKNVQRTIAILADQYPGLGKHKKYLTTFMNQETAFFHGANQLAVLTQFPVVYAAVRKVRRGFYEVTFERIAEPPFTKDDYSMIDKYVRVVERNIKEKPTEWLWSHNRWKKRHLDN